MGPCFRRDDEVTHSTCEPEISQMALVLNEEQSMLRDSARGLISDKAPVSHLRQLRDAKDATGFSRELWNAFAEMGFSGLLVPEQFAGSALACVATRGAMGRRADPVPGRAEGKRHRDRAHDDGRFA